MKHEAPGKVRENICLGTRREGYHRAHSIVVCADGAKPPFPNSERPSNPVSAATLKGDEGCS